MQTGITSWADPASVGALYPFAGSEGLLVIIAVIIWLGWTVWQIRFESATLKEEAEALRKGDNLEKAIKNIHVSSHAYFTE
ncbi:MAG: hypothetical protein AAF485_33290 [Chloroflexota bacterium]